MYVLMRGPIYLDAFANIFNIFLFKIKVYMLQSYADTYQ